MTSQQKPKRNVFDAQIIIINLFSLTNWCLKLSTVILPPFQQDEVAHPLQLNIAHDEQNNTHFWIEKTIPL